MISCPKARIRPIVSVPLAICVNEDAQLFMVNEELLDVAYQQNCNLWYASKMRLLQLHVASSPYILQGICQDPSAALGPV